jgi:hypothetical protein
MPPIFKALASISAWIIVIAGCLTYVITLITLFAGGVTAGECHLYSFCDPGLCEVLNKIAECVTAFRELPSAGSKTANKLWCANIGFRRPRRVGCLSILLEDEASTDY